MRRSHVTSIGHAQQKSEPVKSQGVEHPPVLNDNPPQADNAYRISQKFSKFAPGLPAIYPTAGTSTAVLRDVSKEGKWKLQPPMGPIGSTNPLSVGSTQSTGGAIRDGDGLRVTRYMSAARHARPASLPNQWKDRPGEMPNGTIRSISIDRPPFPPASSSESERVAKANPAHQGGKELAYDLEDPCAHLAKLVRYACGSAISDSCEKPFLAHSFGNLEAERQVNLKRVSEARTGSAYSWELSSRSGRTRFQMHRKPMPTPSDRLLAALPFEARKAVAPPRCKKLDLSHVAPRRWENVSRRLGVSRGLRAIKKVVWIRSSHNQPAAQISLCVLLSRYLVARHVSEDRALAYLAETKTTDYLRSKGYNADHVIVWARILLSSDANQAVLKFVAVANDLSSSGSPSLPTFLLMFILRARSLKATSLRLLLDYLWKHYVAEVQGSTFSATARTIGQQTAMIMTVRLVRHARIVWPSALEEIAAIATKLIGRESEGTISLGRQHIQSLSHLYNRLLMLFAMPTSLRPFLSAATQQRAQFCLVRKMTGFKPHLPLTREGFRALTKVQLAHKKTEPEKQWSQSKALSWPPWKEELLGIDADSEDAGKNSRAAHILFKSTEAGYSRLDWEDTARILAGWDTDGSPTIQTRALLNQGPIVRTADVRHESKQSHHTEHKTWAARILATRTSKEAWACFTSYERSSRGIHAIEPYNAMFARLLHVRKEDYNQDNETTSVVPGDCKETWPEPTSPHDFLYVPTGPPTVTEFFDMMIKRGLRPRKHLLTELLDKAETLAEGVKYINASTLRQQERDGLLGNTGENARHVRTSMSTVAGRVIAAFVRVLCRTQGTREVNFALPTVCGSQETNSKQRRAADPFYYAQSFVSALQPSYKPIWYALFQRLNRRMSIPQVVRRSWAFLLDQVVGDMDALGFELDFDGFKDVGEILEKILLSNRLIMMRQGQECDNKVECVSLCKSVFNAMAYGGSINSKGDIAKPDPWLPLGHTSLAPNRTNLIHIPTPAVLHRTIRILGMAEDIASIITLLRWMHCSAPELASVADELANSKKLIRNVITAVRYFIEKSWRNDDSNELAVLKDEWQPGQKELLSEAKAIIEQHQDDWGEWPTDEELYRYHYVNRKKARWLRESLGLSH